jgi:hypothetical protein
VRDHHHIGEIKELHEGNCVFLQDFPPRSFDTGQHKMWIDRRRTESRKVFRAGQDAAAGKLFRKCCGETTDFTGFCRQASFADVLSRQSNIGYRR